MAGRRIVGAEFPGRRVLRGEVPDLAGRRITEVRRHGKLVAIACDGGVLVIHLGMTGRLLAGGERGPYTRAVFTLEDGTVMFDDIRQFGSVRWLEEPPDTLGPDPLEIAAADLASRLRERRGRIKPLLLDQSFLRGIGNIYADEILFRARIHPKAAAGRLSAGRARALHAAMLEVLSEAIERGGSSVSNYVDSEGRKGSFQLLHRVYRKTGLPCPECGTPIRRIVMSQRGTHYCPRCQRA
jgi:formamidopyrimidine-DNA glycosylase